MQAISAFVFYDRHWDIMTRRLVHSLAGDIAFLIEELRPPSGAEAIARLSDRAVRHFDIELAWRPGDILPNRQPITLFDDTRVAMQDHMRNTVRPPSAIDTTLSDTHTAVL